jgi:hypothetical protein
MAVSMSMNRRVFLKYGIAAATGMAISLNGSRSEDSCVHLRKERLLEVIQKYGSEFGEFKFGEEG